MTFRLELPEPERFDARRPGGPDDRAGAPGHPERPDPPLRPGCSKSGNARLRTALVESAWRWVARDESAARRYRRLVANTGSGKKAIVAMARRLGVLLWRLSVRGEPYRAAA